jgi:hypothetical protein
LPYNQKGNFSSAFLPVAHQGTVINAGAAAPIADLFAPASAKQITKQSERDGLALLNKFNRQHLEQWPGDSRLESRIASYELAAKMQLSAPELLDLAGESETTRKATDLMRKKRGVWPPLPPCAAGCSSAACAFVQVWSGAGGPTNNWDNHADIVKELPPMTRRHRSAHGRAAQGP